MASWFSFASSDHESEAALGEASGSAPRRRFSWMSRDPHQALVAAETALLECGGPWDGRIKYTRNDVALGDPWPGSTLHVVKVSREDGNPESPPLVLWPGYGQGAASYWRNLRNLAEKHPSGTVYALDWLGCGLSSRPKWTCETADDAEQWFVHSFKAWKDSEGLGKVHLLGHSMGGIIAVAYAEQFPEDLASLTLASPAGVPEPPPEPIEERLGQMPWGRRMFFGTAVSLWSKGVTPMGFVRGSGSWIGRSVISGYVQRRFHDSVPDKEEFTDYMFNLYQGEPSGEKALNCMLHPGAHGKKPLVGRVPLLPQELPLAFIYGSRDWMDIRAARSIKSNMPQRTEPIKVHQLRGAGHQLFIDEPRAFDELVLEHTS